MVLFFLAAGGLFFGADGARHAFGQTSPLTAAVIGPNEPNIPESAALVSSAATDAAADVTLKELQAQKKRAVEAADLPDETRAKLAEVYDKAVAQLKLADEFADKKRQYSQTGKAAPAGLGDIQKVLAQSPAAVPASVPTDLTLAQAEQALTQATLDLEEAKKKAVELESEPKRRADRRSKIPEESNAATQQLEEVGKKLAAESGQGQPDPLAEANLILLRLQQRALKNRIEANAEELRFYEVTSELLTAQRDLAARQVAVREKRAAFWQDQSSRLRQQAALTAKEEAKLAKQETQDAHPAIQAIAEEQATLAALQVDLLGQIQQVGTYTERLTETLATTKKDFDDVRQQVETAGKVTDAMGVLLLGKRDKLPNVTESRRRIRHRPSEIASAHLSAMKYEKRWSELSDLTDNLEVIDAQLDSQLPQGKREAIRKEATGYYENQRKTVRAIAERYWDYATRLAALDTHERSLVETVEGFATFIDANVLWVKGSRKPGFSDLRQTASALLWIAAPGNWHLSGAALWTRFKADPLVDAAIVLLILAALIVHPRIHKRIVAISERVRTVQTDQFLLTIQTLVLTLLLAATWPVIMLLIGRRLAGAASDDFSLAVAVGLAHTAWVLLFLNFLRHLVMPHGLAQDHFRLREEPPVFLRRHLRWFLVLLIPVTFVFEVVQAQQVNDTWPGTAGRLFFVTGLALLGAFLLIVLRPTRPLVEAYLKQRRGGWIDRLRYFWYPLCLLVPLTLAVLAGMGYLYGARHLNAKFLTTIGLILLVLLIRALFVRGLTVAQRRLALLERRKRQAATEEATPEAETPSASAEPEQTIFEMSQQTRRLIGAITTILLFLGLWTIWNDVLPAFAKLGEYRLYGPIEQAITLGAVVTALVITVLTVIVARNVPGLLEIVVLRRLPLDRGVRFAIITLSRYLLVIVGLVLAFDKIGIGWAKVQWLIAAMTVGLGFGLQEIFANFVSGLIILFEQPIRVDDIVTVGDVTGRVSMIKIRATTIRRWDQRELIVPNREFITGQLINWTLSDNILRRDFPVGIAYGSDIATAERLLYEIAHANPRVLKDPPPRVLFKGFGDNSLDFELRVNYAGIDNSLPLWHDINVAIDTAFRQAKIEIAFPQRDLHLRSIDPDIPLNVQGPRP